MCSSVVGSRCFGLWPLRGRAGKRHELNGTPDEVLNVAGKVCLFPLQPGQGIAEEHLLFSCFGQVHVFNESAYF